MFKKRYSYPPSSSSKSKKSKTYPKSTRSYSTKVSNPLKMPQPYPGMVSMGLGFPRMLKMEHKYCVQLTPTTLAQQGTNYTFSCNGLYNPSITVGGHQPYYFDQVGALYDHYCVIGAKITVQVVTGPSQTVGLMASLHVDDDSTLTYSRPDYIAEEPDSVFTNISAQQATPVNMVLGWSAKKYFGRDPVSNPELQGTRSSNPTEQSYFAFNLGPADATTTGLFADVFVQIEYIAVWKELTEVNRS